ncbi:Zinc finger, CCHC-type [Gossypium australe]|uniref:Zinc finger, CCHC-type n=1 Tax=Gossypium australe TaxID=47621 RepID=A0A5B6VZ30_9ROSI|nr:Zinc finger, CCHC-type [Gossypium australe]
MGSNGIGNMDNNTEIESVSGLIDTTTRLWKRDLIETTFPDHITQKIFQIPLAEVEHEDFQVWRGEESIQTSIKNFYRKLWNLQIPSKIRITIWRLSWDFISTLKNLKARRVVHDCLCPRCRSAEEDSNHVFRQCPTAIELWKSLNFLWVIRSNITDLWNWLTWVFARGSSNQCRIFCCAVWMLWIYRNKLVHEGKTTTGEELSQRIMNYIEEIDSSNERKHNFGSVNQQSQARRETKATIFFDAAFDSKNSKLASGLVVRGEINDWLASETRIRNKESYFRFVSKEENGEAHNIAVEALRKGEETYLENGALICLQQRGEENGLRDPD